MRVDSRSATYRHQGERLVIETPPTAAGARREAVIWYHGEPADGLVLGPNRYGDFVVFADNWPDRARYWFPGIDHPSDKATVRFEVSAPSWMEVVANGYLVDRIDQGGGRTRTRWSETAEIPTYCMVIGAADFAITRAGEVDGIEITHWSYPADSTAGELAFARSTEIVAFYDSLFGPFPYEKLAHVQSSTRYGGMENAAAIFYGEDTIGEAGLGADSAGRAAGVPGVDELTGLVAHETVHQWFGDAVTEADWRHLWLSEGFATYFAAVFFEFHGGDAGRGSEELTRRMREMRDEVLEYYLETPEPVYGQEPREYESLLTPNNYQKGAWVLHMLRRQVGDEAFFEAIRRYYAALRDGTAWTADLERVAEQVSGQDLGWFFGQWLGRAELPELSVAPMEGDPTRLVVRQHQRGEPFRLDIDLVIEWPGGGRRERVILTGRETVVEAAAPAPIESVSIDPDAGVLFLQTVLGRAEAGPPGPDRASNPHSGGSAATLRVATGQPGG